MRGRLNKILEPAIKKYMDEVAPEIGSSMMSFLFEKDGEAYFYNLQVTKIDEDYKDSEFTGFPVWICMGGDQIPMDGCRKIHRRGKYLKGGVEQPPRRCSFCGNTEFKKIEDLEELRAWREARLPDGDV
jgi:hypothetical protein